MKVVTGGGEIEQRFLRNSLSRLRDFLLLDYEAQVQLERTRCDLILDIGVKDLFCMVPGVFGDSGNLFFI